MVSNDEILYMCNYDTQISDTGMWYNVYRCLISKQVIFVTIL